MSESEAKTITITSTMEPKPDAEHGRDMQAEILAQQELDRITIRLRPVDPGGISPTDPRAKSKSRAKREWKPNEREREILKLSRTGSLAAYCDALDRAGVPFPEKWQRMGKPTSHGEAWDSKSERMRGWIKSDRANVWRRFLNK
jgi:hypothetical protein